MKRELKFGAMQEIEERYSSLYFSDEPIPQEDVEAIMEAALSAPNAFNEQPWRFYVATEEEDRAMLLEYMTPGNALWAKKAPVLIVVAADIYGTHDRTFNYWNAFDAGCAWGYLSLEAQRRGYITHCIGGFDRHDIKREFAIAAPDNVDFFGIIAVGKINEEAAKSETEVSKRKSLAEVSFLRRKPIV